LLENLEFSPEAIVSSPLPRAKQTAEIAGECLAVPVRIEPALAKGFTLDGLRRIVAEIEAECLMFVGHEPDSALIEQLTGGKVKLAKSGLAIVDVNRSCTAGKLRWLLRPKLVKAI
jgi:phosphohistidine phosphatase